MDILEQRIRTLEARCAANDVRLGVMDGHGGQQKKVAMSLRERVEDLEELVSKHDHRLDALDGAPKRIKKRRRLVTESPELQMESEKDNQANGSGRKPIIVAKKRRISNTNLTSGLSPNDSSGDGESSSPIRARNAAGRVARRKKKTIKIESDDVRSETTRRKYKMTERSPLDDKNMSGHGNIKRYNYYLGSATGLLDGEA